jgi:transglutaminase-like putative cysteine protease
MRELMRVFVVAALGLAMAVGLGWWMIKPEAPAEDNLDAERHVFWTLIVRNTGDRALRDVEISSFVPIQRRWNQRLDRIDPRLPHEVVAHDQRPFVRLMLDTVPPFGQREIRIDAVLALASDNAGSPAPQSASFQEPGTLVESKHPEIRNVARTLKRSGTLESARAIHDWLDAAMNRSGYDGVDRGALHALRSSAGDCTEFAALTVALARAMGMSARLVGGYVAAESGSLAFHDYHAWAELAVDGRWLIMDTHRDVFDASPSEYIATHLGLEPGEKAVWSRFYSDEPDLKLTMK